MSGFQVYKVWILIISPLCNSQYQLCPPNPICFLKPTQYHFLLCEAHFSKIVIIFTVVYSSFWQNFILNTLSPSVPYIPPTWLPPPQTSVPPFRIPPQPLQVACVYQVPVPHTLFSWTMDIYYGINVFLYPTYERNHCMPVSLSMRVKITSHTSELHYIVFSYGPIIFHCVK